ncbi:MAG: GtrA family protein, partial [Clostridia bacterium]|nr:GtrA family protein [Clostridia bacterium]
EVLSYLIFGGLTTVVNVGLFMILTGFTALSTGTANAIALAASILFAYVTNKIWVFESKLTGLAAVREFLMFIACRIATGLLDQAIVVAGVDWLGAAIGLAESTLWAGAVKVFANVLVIIANYVFSKLLIFKKDK